MVVHVVGAVRGGQSQSSRNDGVCVCVMVCVCDGVCGNRWSRFARPAGRTRTCQTPS
jgi:hypothetical protein